MKRAVISDIHSNLEAFDAVLADIEAHQVDEIYCLGDLVGYGPNPLECIDRMISLGDRVKVCLLGNHDNAALWSPEGFNYVAEKAIFWTREKIETARDLKKEEREQFLCERPRIYKENDFLYVHGSPRNPLNEYVFFDDIFEEGKMEKLFGLIPQYCFQGHTHVPGIFTEDRHYISSKELGNSRYTLGQQKLMINVGSVGQPRDRDPRACYALVTDDQLEYRRIPYDVDKTFEKIAAIEELDNFLGNRLRIGK